MHQLGRHVQMQHRRHPLVELQGLGETASLHQIKQCHGFARERGTHAGQQPVATESQRFIGQVVHANEQLVAVAQQVAQVGDAADVVGAFLDGDKPFAVGQLQHVFRPQVYPVGHRIVVDHQRPLRGAGHGAHVGHRLARVGHVDYRRHDHVTGHAQLVDAVDIAQRLTGAGLRHIGQHRHAPAGCVHCNPRDLDLFFQ